MIGLGTLVNAATIVAGGALGAFVIPQIPENVRKTTIQALGLGVVLIGFQMAWVSKSLLAVLISLALGSVIGELARIEDRLQGLAARLERWPIGRDANFARNFVQVSVLYCAGAMAITGSLQDGISGDPSILYAKAILDGISAVIFGSVMGPAVMLSAVPVLLYQGAITLAATSISQVLTPDVIREIGATGGLMVAGLGLNLVGAASIKVGNLLPGLLLVAILVAAGL